MQVSWGRLKSPEQLDPGVDEERVTASATYTQPFGKNNLWSTTAAWGRKMLKPGESLDGFLLESAAIFDNTVTLFGRAESVAETLPTVKTRQGLGRRHLRLLPHRAL